MRVFLQPQGVEVWKVVVSRYDPPANLPTDTQGKKLYKDNSMAMSAILSGLTEEVYEKFMNCETAKEIWDKLKNLYSKENCSSSNDDSENDNDSKKVLFLAIDTKETTDDHDGSEEEGEVQLQA